MHQPREPRAIVGPSGDTVRPVLKTVRMGNEDIVTAHYTDPRTGQFITKIPVSVTKVDDK
jgi:hypothetical protein|tara:strand:+ start:618 stop:797 length:180 start_codon:yes stop_codon:yes gene_type:complete